MIMGNVLRTIFNSLRISTDTNVPGSSKCSTTNQEQQVDTSSESADDTNHDILKIKGILCNSPVRRAR